MSFGFYGKRYFIFGFRTRWWCDRLFYFHGTKLEISSQVPQWMMETCHNESSGEADRALHIRGTGGGQWSYLWRAAVWRAGGGCRRLDWLVPWILDWPRHQTRLPGDTKRKDEESGKAECETQWGHVQAEVTPCTAATRFRCRFRPQDRCRNVSVFCASGFFSTV